MAAPKREAPISWRPAKALRSRLEALSKERGQPLAQVIENLVESGLLVAEGTSLTIERKRDGTVEAKPKKSRARTSVCEHRRQPDQFCARCD